MIIQFQSLTKQGVHTHRYLSGGMRHLGRKVEKFACNASYVCALGAKFNLRAIALGSSSSSSNEVGMWFFEMSSALIAFCVCKVREREKNVCACYLLIAASKLICTPCSPNQLSFARSLARCYIFCSLRWSWQNLVLFHLESSSSSSLLAASSSHLCSRSLVALQVSFTRAKAQTIYSFTCTHTHTNTNATNQMATSEQPTSNQQTNRTTNTHTKSRFAN